MYQLLPMSKEERRRWIWQVALLIYTSTYDLDNETRDAQAGGFIQAARQVSN